MAAGPGQTARRLGGALEPVIGQVYFAPECHQRYAALGFAASQGGGGAVKSEVVEAD